jgi:hypothetical protein
MRNMKYLVYIEDRSIKPLVNSIEDAKRHASSYIKYRLPLRIECYSAPITSCIWVYDYHIESWIKTADNHNTDLCCMRAECKQ